ncbi:protein phosphatase 2C domain-containing protein [Cupriavidus sp. CV2]|uniref:PP2C family serine/threonine-protein phosphatase n=1 Tax=Cupriavidus ulmosensis TaxID=3065913 RepID=UPI00296B2B08|nr:PP2C family serine/threonine-protein phosphatase [Cupriavidus sp. CV2]MDW3687709.1 protein phosphatase 2C domain-containing protein [Cupriavidus sp. CV2]
MCADQARKADQSRLMVRCAMLSDVGCVRSQNEDAVGCMIPREDDPFAHAGALAVVADGMGGHAAGEVASRIALRTVLHEYYRDPGLPTEALKKAFVVANQAIGEHVAAEPSCDGMGTTCSAVAIVNDLAYIAHIGDSRIYLLRQREFRQLTEDDSLVGEMFREGLLTAEEANRHPDKNVLLRALGAPEYEPAVSPDGFPLEHDDVLMLCTDGISDQIDDATIASVIMQFEPVDACQKLIELARMAGGLDNASVAICSLQRQRTRRGASVRSTRETNVPPNVTG